MNLQKLFVWVAKGVAFDGVTVSTANPSKIYFDANTNKIWVKGTSFGFEAGDVETLKNAIDTLNGGVNVSGSVDQKIKAAVDGILGGEGINQAYDTIKEIADWIAADPTHAKDLLASISANKTAIEAEVTRATTKEGELAASISANTTAIGNEKSRAEAAEGELSNRIGTLEAKKHVVSDKTATAGNYVSGVHVSETGALTIDETALPQLAVKAGSGDFVAVDNHQVEIKTVSLIDTVGMTKGSDGTWTAGTVAGQVNGLATAADVAAEIVADEEVIAAALNDHESRLKNIFTTLESSPETLYWETYTQS